MSNKGKVARLAIALAAVLAVATLLGACSTSSDTTVPIPAPTPAPTPAPAPPLDEPAPIPEPSTPAPSNGAAGDTNDREQLISLGKTLYNGSAGGVGCAMCHAADARGDIGPNLLGRSLGDIQFALENNDQMSFISVTPEEVEAIAAYLQQLNTQP